MFEQYCNFQAIANNTASSIKVGLIKRFSADPIFVQMLELAYDPTVTYGVTMGHRGGTFVLGQSALTEGLEAPAWEAFTSVLSDLSSRKLTGSRAHAALWGLLERSSFETQWILAGILNKDFRIGIGAKTINKALPNLVPDFSCMLAHKDPAKIQPETSPGRAELKYNGDRNFAIIDNREVQFLSRKGHLILGHNSVRKEILENFADKQVLDGEHMKGIYGDENPDAPMAIYDILPLEAFYSRSHPKIFRERRAELEQKLPQDTEFLELSKGQECNSLDEVYEYAGRVWDNGGEGLVWKPWDGLYEFTRSHNWVKIKPEKTADVPIVDYSESKKVPGTLGAIVVEFEGKRFKLGSGFTPDQRVDLWNAPHRIGDYVEFVYTTLSPYGIPVCARFKRFRSDLEAT